MDVMLNTQSYVNYGTKKNLSGRLRMCGALHLEGADAVTRRGADLQAWPQHPKLRQVLVV